MYGTHNIMRPRSKKAATIPVSLSLAVDACSTGKGLVVCGSLWPCAVPTPLPDTCLHT